MWWSNHVLIQGEKDDKIIAVCADDPEYKHYTDIKELPPHRLTEIRRFFEDCILFHPQIAQFVFHFVTLYVHNVIILVPQHIYTDKKNENKEVAVNEFMPANHAVDAIQYSM